MSNAKEPLLSKDGSINGYSSPASCGLSLYSPSSLFRKCDPNTLINPEGDALNRVLTVWELIGTKLIIKSIFFSLLLLGYGVASTVGAGIFVTVGIVASQNAGPGIAISFLLAGLYQFK